MGIQIYRTPARRDDTLSYSVSGETLKINGVNYDLSEVGDPTQIDNDFVSGQVYRLNGDVHVLLVAPYKAGEAPIEADVMPDPPPPESATYRISKTTPWLRMTEDEAATIDGVMSQTDARLKQIYMAATYLDSADELWATMMTILTDAFGATRANELLAPET